MGELFFLIKTSILTGVLVVLSQVSIRGKTLENHILMRFEQSKVAQDMTHLSEECVDYLLSKNFIQKVQTQAIKLKNGVKNKIPTNQKPE